MTLTMTGAAPPPKKKEGHEDMMYAYLWTVKEFG